MGSPLGQRWYADTENHYLNAIDSSGHSFLSKAAGWVKKNGRTLAAVAISIAAPYAAWSVWGTGSFAGFMATTGGLAVSAASGFAAGMVTSGGDLRAGLIGAATAMAFYGVGSAAQGLSKSGVLSAQTLQVAKVVAHGVVGGVSARLNGGKFNQGFLSAGMAQTFAPAVDGIMPGDYGLGGRISRVAAAAVVGGTASELGGGKFANGAVTGAFSRAFNDELHFDGRKLRQYSPDSENGDLVGEWDAVSGREGSTIADQEKAGYGPIPEGRYTFDAAHMQDWSSLSLIDKALALIGRGSWPGGTYSWGENRVFLSPNSGTQTFGRSGFSIHGGAVPGSAGCIDLTHSMPSFAQQMGGTGPQTLIVDY